MYLKYQVAIAATAGVAAGVAGGWFTAKHILGKQFDERLRDELAMTRAYYERNTKTLTVKEAAEAAGITVEDTPADVEAAVEALQTYQGVEEMPQPDYVPEHDETLPTANEILERRTLFKDHTWDQNAEESKRKTLAIGAPYVISIDEWNDPDEQYDEYEKITLTYYEGDKVLADDKDEEIPRPAEILPGDALHRFGDGSGEEHTVLVRNPRLKVDYEITQNLGSYGVDVLGFDEEQFEPMGRKQRLKD